MYMCIPLLELECVQVKIFFKLDSKQILPNEETRDQKKKSSFQIELSVVKENYVIGL